MLKAEQKNRKSLISRIPKLKEIPWWGLLIGLLGIIAIFLMINSENYREAFSFVSQGIKLTIYMSLIAFGLALILGLITGIAQTSKNVIIYNISSFYIGIVRGVPILVIILYFAFVAVPMIMSLFNNIGKLLVDLNFTWGFLGTLSHSLINANVRDIDDIARGIIALSFAFGAFESEIFRAGIQAISTGQMEAARSLGMTYMQSMRYIVLPQAFRIVIPPLINDFISMVKDTSLVSALGVREVTQLGKLYRGATFRTFETWNTVLFIYLCLTFVLQIFEKLIEKKMRIE
jgi:polar amino acid transport system permease protein